MSRLPLRLPRATIAAIAVLAATATGLAVALSGCGPIGGRTVDTVGDVDFDTPLLIPPLAPSTIESDGTRRFDLTAAAGTTEFTGGAASETWGYSAPGAPSSYLGPMLRATRGERVRVDVHNDLDAVTTLHWHGMHLPAAMDGGPHQPIDPGDTWSPNWAIDQPAATLWYHPHPHGETETQVAKGLAGMFILDDPIEQALPLPREYGVDDVPVIVQDTSFDDEGRRDSLDDQFVGKLGDSILVNGTVGPYLDVETDVVRLRLLNASTARIYDFGFSDARDFDQIASDGGLLDAPRSTDHIVMSPGERAEVLVRMTPGETVTLRSTPPDIGVMPILSAQAGVTDSFDVLELRAATSLRTAGAVPAMLAPHERLDPDAATYERTLVFDDTQIDQTRMDMTRIDQVVELGATEVWSVTNNMAFPHNFHLHDVQFQVDEVGDGAPPAEDLGWKDTVLLRPNTEYRLVVRFDDYADPEHPYMYHCHLLRHEDQGMMGQFVVVEPGTAADDAEVPDTIGTGETHEH